MRLPIPPPGHLIIASRAAEYSPSKSIFQLAFWRALERLATLWYLFLVPLSNPRKALVQFLIAAVVFFSLLDMITQRQDFPFAPFDMYSGIYRPGSEGKPAYEALVITLVTPNGTEIVARSEYLSPFDTLRLAESLENSLHNSAVLQSKLAEIYRLVIKNHETNSFIPEIKGIRLYMQVAVGKKKMVRYGDLKGANRIAEYVPAAKP